MATIMKLLNIMTGRNSTCSRSKPFRKRRNRGTLKGGCASIGSAILPFGLLGLQKYLQDKPHNSGGKSYGKRYRRRGRSMKRISVSDESV